MLRRNCFHYWCWDVLYVVCLYFQRKCVVTVSTLVCVVQEYPGLKYYKYFFVLLPDSHCLLCWWVTVLSNIRPEADHKDNTVIRFLHLRPCLTPLSISQLPAALLALFVFAVAVFEKLISSCTNDMWYISRASSDCTEAIISNSPKFHNRAAGVWRCEGT